MAYKADPDRYLTISDLQIPFEHDRALEFCKYLQKQFRIPKENVICLGDEIDEYAFSNYESSPDALYTPACELVESIQRLKEWYKAFPIMRVCISNHGVRWQKRAFEAGLPVMLMRAYEEVLCAPKGWSWHKRIDVKTKHPFVAMHGDDFGGQHPHIQAAMHLGISVIMGHFHSIAATRFIKTEGYDIWGAVAGSLINASAYAFEYSRKAKQKPQIGTHIILDGGSLPIWVPMD